MHILKPAEPFELAAGELAGGLFDFFSGIVEGEQAAEVVLEDGVARGFAGCFGE